MNDKLLDYIRNHPLLSSQEIYNGIESTYSYPTLKRELSKLLQNNLIVTEGKGKGTKYRLSPEHELIIDVHTEKYFSLEQDERQINASFNFSLIHETLTGAKLFTSEEYIQLGSLQKKFINNVAHLSKAAYNKEMERLAIDLSWKSSQIEGNTYSLLETEQLLREQKTAAGKPKDDATMLLNHKEAINFIIAHPDYVVPLTVRSIEDIH